MAINTIQGYAPSTTEPIDSRIIKANASARLAIPTFDAYKGLLVYQQDTGELYVCNNPSNPSLEASWAKIFTSTGTSGSYTGSFQGDGAGLTNVPASGIVGLNLSQTSTGSVSASVNVTSDAFTLTSASVELFKVSNTGILSGSGANLYDIPASGIVGLNLSRTATGSVTASVDVGTNNFQVISGSTSLMSVNSNGKIAVSKSINIGTPTINPWGTGLQGSYFNNFTSGSDVADVLRFIAGLLSASAPDAAPNTKTWASTNIDLSLGGITSKSTYMSGILGGSTTYTNARLSQEWNQSNTINLALTGSYRRLQSYLIGKGWMNSSETGSNTLHDVGTHPFGISTYGANIPSNIYNTFGTFTFNADSINTSTTVFSSSIGVDAFGLGTLVNPTTVTPYSVYISTTQSFSDTASVTTPSTTSTYSTSSLRTYTLSTQNLTGDANGLYLGIINTGNSLIPNAYQDGKFLNTPAGYTGRKWNDVDADRTTGATTSSIGYYRLHGLVVGLTSGSQIAPSTRSLSTSDSTGLFYMPSLGTLGVSNIIASNPTVLINSDLAITSFSATSRSLSGAPYLLTTNYTIRYNTQVSKSFDPCYGYSTSPISVDNPTNTWSTRGTTSLTGTSVSVTSNGVQTSSSIAGVFPAGTSPLSSRNINSIPAIGDVSFLSSSFTFSLTSNSNNVIQSRITQANTNYSLTFRTAGANWINSALTSTSNTINFYTASLFGQPSTSGSMAIYSFPQGYDSRVLTTRTESFDGEDFRLKIDNNLLSGSWANGTKFTTDTADYYNLTSLDLQVKPKFLVRPGQSNGYWLTDDGTEFKYYAVAFNSNDSNQINSINLSINLSSGNIIKWNQTSIDGVACLLIFSNAASLNNAIDVKEDSLTTQTFTAGTNGTNPFTSNITVYKNTATYPTVGIGSPFLLNGSNQNFVVLIRMRGDVGPITSISYS